MNGQKFKERKTIYCQPIVLSTPVKQTEPPLPPPASAAKTPPQPGLSVTTLPGQNALLTTQQPNASTNEPPKLPSLLPKPTTAGQQVQEDISDRHSDSDWNPETGTDEFLFSPRNKSKLLNWSESEAESCVARDESDRWLSMKDNKRKGKRRKAQSPLTANAFKKQDKKMTPK